MNPDAPTPETRDAAPDPVKMLADVVNEAKRLWHGDYQTGEDELAALQRLIDRTREVQRILRESRTPPAGVKWWIGWDKSRSEACWLFSQQPSWSDDEGGIMHYTTGGKCERINPEFAISLGLAPGECARVRLTREAE